MGCGSFGWVATSCSWSSSTLLPIRTSYEDWRRPDDDGGVGKRGYGAGVTQLGVEHSAHVLDQIRSFERLGEEVDALVDDALRRDH